MSKLIAWIAGPVALIALAVGLAVAGPAQAEQATVGASSAAAAAPYPKEVRKGFRVSCRSAAVKDANLSKKRASKLCKRALRCIEKSMSFEKFTRLALKGPKAISKNRTMMRCARKLVDL